MQPYFQPVNHCPLSPGEDCNELQGSHGCLSKAPGPGQEDFLEAGCLKESQCSWQRELLVLRRSEKSRVPGAGSLLGNAGCGREFPAQRVPASPRTQRGCQAPSGGVPGRCGQGAGGCVPQGGPPESYQNQKKKELCDRKKQFIIVLSFFLGAVLKRTNAT